MAETSSAKTPEVLMDGRSVLGYKLLSGKIDVYDTAPNMYKSAVHIRVIEDKAPGSPIHPYSMAHPAFCGDGRFSIFCGVKEPIEGQAWVKLPDSYTVTGYCWLNEKQAQDNHMNESSLWILTQVDGQRGMYIIPDGRAMLEERKKSFFGLSRKNPQRDLPRMLLENAEGRWVPSSGLVMEKLPVKNLA